MSEKQIVDAFKAFFEKNILPSVNDNEQIMKEWNHLSKLINSQPIDYSQIDFYLLLANKNNNNNNISSARNNPMAKSHTKINDNESKFKRNDFSHNNDFLSPADRNTDKKHSQIGAITNKKKHLMQSLEIFQKLIQQNQERLELLTKKQIIQDSKPHHNTSFNGMLLRRY